METLEKLKKENCFDPNGVLSRWPEWLEWDQIQGIVKQGLLVRKFYQYAYGHVDYILA